MKEKIANWTRQKGGRPWGHRLIQIDAELDAGRAQLVVDGETFKKFSQGRE